MLSRSLSELTSRDQLLHHLRKSAIFVGILSPIRVSNGQTLGMDVKSDHDDNPTRSSMSQACFRRAPWNEKMALVLSTCQPFRSNVVFLTSSIAADETSWPACLFILKLLLKQIIKLEKQEDSRIMTSKASPHLKTFIGDNDDFRFHHYFDFICGAGVGG